MCMYVSARARRKNERTDSDIEFSSSAVIKIMKNLGHGFVPRLSDLIFFWILHMFSRNLVVN